MAIVDDYAAISAEMRRIQAERSPQEKPAGDAGRKPTGQHPMRATIAGDLLYRRLVSQPAQRQRGLDRALIAPAREAEDRRVVRKAAVSGGALPVTFFLASIKAIGRKQVNLADV